VQYQCKKILFVVQHFLDSVDNYLFLLIHFLTSVKLGIKIRKRAHTPILKGVDKLSKPFQVPWLDNKTIKILWTA
jgi:hypothetical protein